MSADQREEKEAGMPTSANEGCRNERTGGERMETVQLSPSPNKAILLQTSVCNKSGFCYFKVELPVVSADQREEKVARRPPPANEGGRNERTGSERMETLQHSPVICLRFSIFSGNIKK